MLVLASIGKAVSREEAAGTGGWSASLSASMLLLLLLLSTKTASGRPRTFNCTGAPDGALACTGCSRQFAQHSLCEACLAETFDVGPVCTRCQKGKAAGPLRAASCQPVCFYCLGCERRSLGDIGNPRVGVSTCRCDVSRLLQAFSDGGTETAPQADIWDGRYGIMMIELGENRSGIIDGCQVDVGCFRTDRRHETVLLSKNCTSVQQQPHVPVRKGVLMSANPKSTTVPAVTHRRADANSTGNARSVNPVDDQSAKRAAAGETNELVRTQPVIAESVRDSAPITRSLRCSALILLGLSSLIAAR